MARARAGTRDRSVHYLQVGTVDDPGALFDGTPQQFDDGFDTSAPPASVVAWATRQQLQVRFLPAAPLQ